MWNSKSNRSRCRGSHLDRKHTRRRFRDCPNGYCGGSSIIEVRTCYAGLVNIFAKHHRIGKCGVRNDGIIRVAIIDGNNRRRDTVWQRCEIPQVFVGNPCEEVIRCVRESSCWNLNVVANVVGEVRRRIDSHLCSRDDHKSRCDVDGMNDRIVKCSLDENISCTFDDVFIEIDHQIGVQCNIG